MHALPPADAARIVVVFDGEKRLEAYGTFRKLRARVAAAVFDDVDKGGSRFFAALRKEGEVFWTTKDARFAAYRAQQRAYITQLVNASEAFASSTLNAEDLDREHIAIVRGGGWR